MYTHAQRPRHQLSPQAVSDHGPIAVHRIHDQPFGGTQEGQRVVRAHGPAEHRQARVALHRVWPAIAGRGVPHLEGQALLLQPRAEVAGAVAVHVLQDEYRFHVESSLPRTRVV